MPTPSPTFPSLHTYLLTFPPPLRPVQKPHSASLTAAIAAASLHPTLEAALHILNHDLPSAHFLVRHMQSAPAFEGMFLHGILHRVEGDYDNARAWYGDVEESEIYESVWGKGGEGEREQENGRGKGFIDRIQKLVKEREGDEASLAEESRREIEGVIEFCKKKFGEGKVEDATGAWVKNSEKIQGIAEKQLVGGEGFRKF